MSQLAKENNVQCWTFEKALKKVLKDGFFYKFLEFHKKYCTVLLGTKKGSTKFTKKYQA